VWSSTLRSSTAASESLSCFTKLSVNMLPVRPLVICAIASHVTVKDLISPWKHRPGNLLWV